MIFTSAIQMITKIKGNIKGKFCSMIELISLVSILFKPPEVLRLNCRID
jgi:hypothetical protein